VRLVLDTSILVAAIRGPGGASRFVVRAGLTGLYVPLISTPLILEYESVMTRPEHEAVSGLTGNEVNELLDAFVAASQQVKFFYTWRPAVDDPGDEMVVETAVNGQAEGIVTFNVRDFRRVEERFGVGIMTPQQAARRIRHEAE
jgi:predicted nucleic acid-binding protein